VRRRVGWDATRVDKGKYVQWREKLVTTFNRVFISRNNSKKIYSTSDERIHYST